MNSKSDVIELSKRRQAYRKFLENDLVKEERIERIIKLDELGEEDAAFKEMWNDR